MPGMGELIIILLIVLVVFGANKLPGIGDALGRSIKNFKKASNVDGEAEEDDDKADKKGRKELAAMRVKRRLAPHIGNATTGIANGQDAAQLVRSRCHQQCIHLAARQRHLLHFTNLVVRNLREQQFAIPGPAGAPHVAGRRTGGSPRSRSCYRRHP